MLPASPSPAGPPTKPSNPAVPLPLGDIVEVQAAGTQVPTMHALSQLAGEGQWARIVEQLRPLEEALPAQQRLLYAVALRESGAPEEESRRADAMAMAAVATLLDVPADGALPRMLARRIQRRSWRQAPAPRPRVQVAVMVVAVTIGALVGWAWDEWVDRRVARPTPAECADVAP